MCWCKATPCLPWDRIKASSRYHTALARRATYSEAYNQVSWRRACLPAPSFSLVLAWMQVRRVVEDCIKNVHPIYHIKTLMIKRELAKDPNLATENWDRFLPKFQKKNVKRKKAPIVKKPEYTPFPPPQQPSKVDLQLESGEYFLSQSQKAARKAADQQEQQRQRVLDKQQERLKAFVPPQVSIGLLAGSGIRAGI